LLALDANDDKYGYALPASGDSCPQVCTGTGKAQYCYTPSSCLRLVSATKVVAV